MKECEVCKRHFLKIHVHHKNGDRLINTSNNLINVCEDCHSVIHHGLKNGGKRSRSYKDQVVIKRKLKILREVWLENRITPKPYEESYKLIIDKIKENKNGIHITRLVNETMVSRSTVRNIIAFLKGAKKINEKQVGMAKVYFLK